MEIRSDTYPECKHIPKPPRPTVTEEEIVGGDDILPLFERKISNYRRQRQCSLQANELLRCRWASYMRSSKGFEHASFKFPSLRHIHYHNYDVKYKPSETPHTWESHKKRLMPGPGIDAYGQMPIPEDMHVLKSTSLKERPLPLKSKRHRHKAMLQR